MAEHEKGYRAKVLGFLLIEAGYDTEDKVRDLLATLERWRLDRIAARDLLETLTIVIPGPKCVSCGWEPPSCTNVLRKIKEFLEGQGHE